MGYRSDANYFDLFLKRVVSFEVMSVICLSKLKCLPHIVTRSILSIEVHMEIP